MPPTTYKLGPGEIRIGETGSEVDFSAQLTGATVSWDNDSEDDTPVLSGDVIAGDRSYTATISGNVFQDLGAVDGLVEWTWTNKGVEVPIVYVPSSAAGRAVTGRVIVDPIDVGGDEVKTRPRSDFEWSFVGEPELGTAPAPLGFASLGEPVDEVTS